jgi:tetratricopeptide (TPR) repeat protein
LHHHGDGWSYLFSGKKRWFFNSPHSLPLITHMGFIRMRYWYEKGVYPKLSEREKPLECVQDPGDLMYVPEGWWHGTLNEGAPSSLSVAAQRRTGMTRLERKLAKANLEKNKGQNNKAFKSLREIVKEFPENAEAWYVLGIVYGRVRKFHLDDELEAKQRAYELTGGRNCDVMNNLGSALVHHERFKEAEDVLRDAIVLCEWDDYAWSNLAATLHAQGREDEAEKAFDHGKELSMKWNRPQMVSVGSEELML